MANYAKWSHNYYIQRLFFAEYAHLKADLYLVFNSLFQNKGLFLQHFQVSCNIAGKEDNYFLYCSKYNKKKLVVNM